jgi:hypothetical protein
MVGVQSEALNSTLNLPGIQDLAGFSQNIFFQEVISISCYIKHSGCAFKKSFTAIGLPPAL